MGCGLAGVPLAYLLLGLDGPRCFSIELRAGRGLLIAKPESGLLSTIRHLLLECTNSDRIFGVAEQCREQRIFFLKLAGQEITE